MPATNASTTPPQPAQQQPAPRPFTRGSDMQGPPLREETVFFLRTFLGWQAGQSAGFNSERARWLYQKRIARPYNPATDHSGYESNFVVRK